MNSEKSLPPRLILPARKKGAGAVSKQLFWLDCGRASFCGRQETAQHKEDVNQVI